MGRLEAEQGIAGQGLWGPMVTGHEVQEQVMAGQGLREDRMVDYVYSWRGEMGLV